MIATVLNHLPEVNIVLMPTQLPGKAGTYDILKQAIYINSDATEGRIDLTMNLLRHEFRHAYMHCLNQQFAPRKFVEISPINKHSSGEAWPHNVTGDLDKLLPIIKAGVIKAEGVRRGHNMDAGCQTLERRLKKDGRFLGDAYGYFIFPVFDETFFRNMNEDNPHSPDFQLGKTWSIAGEAAQAEIVAENSTSGLSIKWVKIPPTTRWIAYFIYNFFVWKMSDFIFEEQGPQEFDAYVHQVLPSFVINYFFPGWNRYIASRENNVFLSTYASNAISIAATGELPGHRAVLRFPAAYPLQLQLYACQKQTESYLTEEVSTINDDQHIILNILDVLKNSELQSRHPSIVSLCQARMAYVRSHWSDAYKHYKKVFKNLANNEAKIIFDDCERYLRGHYDLVREKKNKSYYSDALRFIKQLSKAIKFQVDKYIEHNKKRYVTPHIRLQILEAHKQYIQEQMRLPL